MSALYATEAISPFSAETDNGFLRLKGTIAKERILLFTGKELAPAVPGLKPEKKYKVFRSAESLSTDETLRSFAEAPLLLGHHDVTPANIREHQAGHPVGDPVRNTESTIGVGYLLTSSEAIGDYRSNKARQLSPYIRFDAIAASEGKPYDFTMANVRCVHVAQVPRGKNGPSIRLSEEDMTDVTLSDEAQTSLATKIAESLTGVLKTLGIISSEEDPDDKNKKKKTTLSREEHATALDQVKRLYKDKELVGPLLVSEEARKAVAKSEDSIEVLAIALSVSEEDAKESGAAVLRGRAEERIAAREKQPRRSARSWEQINNPGGGDLKPGERVTDPFYKNYADPLGRRAQQQANN